MKFTHCELSTFFRFFFSWFLLQIFGSCYIWGFSSMKKSKIAGWFGYSALVVVLPWLCWFLGSCSSLFFFLPSSNQRTLGLIGTSVCRLLVLLNIVVCTISQFPRRFLFGLTHLNKHFQRERERDRKTFFNVVRCRSWMWAHFKCRIM